MWLALYIPALPLQAFSRTLIESGPVAVFEREKHRDRIVASNRKARLLGIKPNCTLAEASALSDELISLPRDVLRETGLLHELAVATSHITPNIHISELFGLLLEVSGSLTLFGDVHSLLDAAIKSVEQRKIRAHAVIAPSARGARWLARAHRQLVITDQLDQWLDDLPLGCTDLPLELISELQELNLHHLAAVRCLPPDQLGRRFGPYLSHALSQAYGRATQSLSYWQPVVVFKERVELPDLVREQSHWMPAITILLQRLQDFLLQRASTSTCIAFSFLQGSQKSTELQLHAAHGIQQAHQWQRLLEARLERTTIAHEVSILELRCQQTELMQFADRDFFDHSQESQIEWKSLLELIRSRIGNQSLLEAPHHNHNALPESTAICSGESSIHNRSDPLRPVWLVEPPRRLGDEILRKLRYSPRIHHPERVLENWASTVSNQPVERDYYIVITQAHSAWWIFRERIAGHWFLHGIFA